MQVTRLAVGALVAWVLGCSSNEQEQAQLQTADSKPSSPTNRDVQPSSTVEHDTQPVVNSRFLPEPVVDGETAARFEEVARKLHEAGELEHALYVEKRLQAHTDQP